MIERMAFGTTGHSSSRVIFGAAALGGCNQDRADATLEILDAHGVNHLDVAASYGDAELRLAPWMEVRRGDFFLATKTGERTGSEARRELERSMERMGTDHIDLIQLHNLVEDNEWKTAFRAKGAVDALFQARDEGMVGHVGVTGHGKRIAKMHLRSLNEAPFASVLLPYNFTMLDMADYYADVAALLERCAADGVAVQTIKSIAKRRWPEDHSGHRFSWYEPLDDGPGLPRAVHFVLNNRQVFLNSSSDLRRLEPTLNAAQSLPDPATHDPEAPSLVDQLREDARVAESTALFDGDQLECI
jgi:aryl-alcohol dehydrogenase-like predicted oxidoreductase